MAPPRLYSEPHEQLVVLLMRARDQGFSFEQAWMLTVRPGLRTVLTNTRDAPDLAVRWPTDTNTRIEWQAAIRSLKDSFRRAYERRPVTRRELAVVGLFAPPARGIPPDAVLRSAA